MFVCSVTDAYATTLRSVTDACSINAGKMSVGLGEIPDFKNQSIHLEVDGELQTIPISRVAKANLVIEI